MAGAMRFGLAPIEHTCRVGCGRGAWGFAEETAEGAVSAGAGSPPLLLLSRVTSRMTTVTASTAAATLSAIATTDNPPSWRRKKSDPFGGGIDNGAVESADPVTGGRGASESHGGGVGLGNSAMN